MLGVPVPKVAHYEQTIAYLLDLLESAPSVLFVRSAETEDLLESG